jgi:hypothetical protein
MSSNQQTAKQYSEEGRSCWYWNNNSLCCRILSVHYMRDCMEVMPPIFFRKCNCNNNEISTNYSYIFCNYEAILPQSLHHLQHTFTNADQDAVYQCCKIPCLDFTAHHKTLFQFVGIHIVHPLQIQTGGSWRIPDPGCQHDGEGQSTPLFQLPHAHCHDGEGCHSRFD